MVDEAGPVRGKGGWHRSLLGLTQLEIEPPGQRPQD